MTVPVEIHRGLRESFPFLALAAAILLQSQSAVAQLTSPSAATAASAPSVFFDCERPFPCDQTHFRTEIRFVNWAQDPADADVHVIATSEAVGGGGRRHILDFIGRGRMGELTDRLTYTSSGTDVPMETLDGVTQALRLGLMRFALESGLGSAFDLRFTGDLPALTSASDVDGDGVTPARVDPWNAWTFRVGLSGNLDLRETSTDSRISPSFSADRVTEAWKLGFSANVDYRRSGRELSDGREVRDDRDDWSLEGLIVKSISGHFSMGATFSGQNSVSNNQDARIRFAPAVEYNYFPYAEANRRQLTVQYSAGFEHSNYIEETIYNAFEETRPRHTLDLRYNAREPWGNAGVGVNYAQYLNDTDLYRLSLNGNMSFRITRGLDLNLRGNAARVLDQVHVPLSDIPDEDILLGRQNLPSSYRLDASIGLSYRWGSSFTNIVNTRFSSS